MKKMKFLTVAVFLVILASCSGVSDKTEGTYNGNYKVMGTDYPGKIKVTKASGDKVNMELVCYSPSMIDQAEGVSVTSNGNAVTFSYNNTTTAYLDMISVTGTLDGNTVVLDGVLSLGTGSVGTGVFTGTK